MSINCGWKTLEMLEQGLGKELRVPTVINMLHYIKVEDDETCSDGCRYNPLNGDVCALFRKRLKRRKDKCLRCQQCHEYEIGDV